MILSDIEAKLKEIDPNVDYGMVSESRRETKWNYIVFNRSTIRRNANKTAASDFFDVHIVRENYVPDGMDDEVISKLCELSGVRLADKEIDFNYVMKSSDTVVEMMNIYFVRARK